MVSPINPTQLTPPRVALIDDRSGAISREWYRFFLSLLNATETNQAETELSPDTSSLLASYDAMLADLAQTTETQPDCCASGQAILTTDIQGLSLTPAAASISALAVLQSEVQALALAPLGNTTSSLLGTFTAGSVIFAGASGTLTQNNANFFWDNTNTFLGVGTNLPVAKLQVTYDGPAIKTDGADSTNISPDVQIARSSSGTAIQSGPNVTFSDGTANNTVAIQNSQGNLGFWNYGSATWLERVRIGALGSVGIGTSTLTAKLNVSTDGSAIKTDGASSANIVADVQIARSSSGTAIQSGPNITFSDGTANNTVAIQNSQGNLGFWNFGSATWLERVRIGALGSVGIGTSTLTAKLNISTDGSAINTDGASSANIVADVQLTRSSSGTAIQSGPNITFSDGTTNNTIAIQNSQGNLAFWNFGSATWLERMRIGSNGNVGIGATANASALLDVQSTTKGFRLPNMTTTQKNAITSPAAGLMVFDTTLAKACVYSGSAWQTITSL